MHDLIPLKVTQGIHASSYRTPHKVAVWHGDRSVTYKQLTNRMRRVSYAAFTDIHFQGNVALVAQNSIEFLEIFLGLADVGVPVVTINPKNTSREVIGSLVDSKTRVLFIDEKLYKDEYKQYVDVIITIGEEYESWLSKQQSLSKYPLVKESIFNIIYTSGTTGAPKGICISHRSRLLSFYTMAVDYGCMGTNDTILTLVSLSNGGGNTTTLSLLNSGGTVVLGTQVHPEYIMRMVEKYKVTCLMLVPVLIHMIVNTPSCSKYDSSSLKAVMGIAAPFNVDLKEKAVAFFGHKVWDLYASTECGPTTSLSPSLFKDNIASVGLPVSGSIVKIINDQGNECQPFEVGEIYAQTLTLFSGYLISGYLNRLDPSEFVTAEDLGYKDENGFLYILGRKNDMIISGGYNVYPEEVESILNTCPGVIESAVVGIPDDMWGEVVTAFIVGAPEIDPIMHCKNSLASYKIPRKIFYIDSIPRNDAGKILRKNLRKHYK